MKAEHPLQSLRVLVGVNEIANNIREIANALSGACERVDTLAIVNPFYRANRYTYALHPEPGAGFFFHWRNVKFRLLRKFFQVAGRYDVFVFISGLSFVPGFLDLLLLRLMGKKIVMMNVGDDVRFRPLHNQIDQALLGRKWLPEVPALSGTLHFLRTLVAQQFGERVCHRLLSMRNQATFQSRPFFFFRFPMSPLRASAKQAASRPLIVHAPSDPEIKGTAIVLEAIKALSQKNLPFDFELIMHRDNSYVIERLQKADIVIDQPATWVARFAAEGLACSCVVVGGNEPEYEGVPGNERSPVQPFHPDAAALAARIESLVMDVELRQRLMTESFAYWQRTYSPGAFAQYFLEVLNGRGQLINPRPMHKRMLLEAARNPLQRMLIRMLV